MNSSPTQPDQEAPAVSDVDGSFESQENNEIIHESVAAQINQTVERYQNLVQDILSAKPDILKEKPGSQAHHILTQVVEGLNQFAPVSISIGPINDAQPFSVALVDETTEKFPVDRLRRWENGEDIKLDIERTQTTKPVQTLQITLSPDFNFAHLPGLLARIENQHAAMVLRNREESSDVSSLFIDQLKKITAFYLYFGQKIAEMAQENPEWNQTMTESLEIYSQVCLTLGTLFAQANPSLRGARTSDKNTNHRFDLTDQAASQPLTAESFEAILDNHTTKWLREVCWPRMRATIEKTFDRLTKKADFSWDAFFRQFDQEIADMLTDELNKSFAAILMQRARTEFLRQSDTLTVLQENAGIFQWDKSIGGRFPQEWKELNTLRSEYQKVKKSGDVEALSRIEKKVADTLTAIVFCSDFWSLDDATPSLSDTAQTKKINHASQAEILHQALNHFLGIETWAAITTDNFLSVLPLSDGRLLALASPPYILGTAQKKTEPQIVPETGKSWLVLNEHKNLYEANHWNAAALGFESKGNWTEAEYCYRQSLKLTPQDPIIHNNLGIVLYKQNRLEASRKHLEKALKVAPDEPIFLNAYGHYLHRTGQTQNAFEYFKIASLKDPNNSIIKSDYAYALQAIGEKKLALREWEEAMNLAPHDLGLVLTYTDALQAHGRYQEAADIIRNRLETAETKDKPELHLEYGIVLETMGEVQMARREYETFLSFNPKNIYAWDRLHLLLEKSGTFAETETAYERAMEIFPDNADLVNNYAFFLKGQNIDDEAEINFGKAIKMKPMNAIYRNNYALLLEKLNRNEEAGIQYEHALQFNPNDPTFAKNAADFFAKQGNLERAEGLFKKAAEIAPDKFQYLNAYVIFLEKHNRYDEAQQVYEQWLEKFPNNPDLLNNRAVSLHQAGRYEQAYEAGLKTFEQQSDNPIYADNLCSFIVAGDLNTAADKFANLQKKYPNNVIFDNCASLVPLFLGEFAEAETQVNALLKKYPNNAYTLMTAANFYDRGEFTGFLNNLPEELQKEYYQKFQNHQKALKLYTQAIQARKTNPDKVPINYREIEQRIDTLEKTLLNK